MQNRMTDKGLVIGFTAADIAPAPAKEVVMERVEVPETSVMEQDEAPVMEAEAVSPDEAPRRGRGRPRKYID